MRGRITKSSVDALKPGRRADGSLRREKLWDTAVTGFGCVVTPTGHKSYIFQYRTRNQTRRDAPKRITIARHGEITPDKARAIASELLHEVRSGDDPKTAWDKSSNRTVGDLASLFVNEYLPNKKRPPRAATLRSYTGILNTHIIPRLGKRNVEDITMADVESLHQSMRSTLYQANRMLSLLRQLFSHAERLGWRQQGNNPAVLVERYSEESRGSKKAVMLSSKQMTRLLDAIQAEVDGGGDPYACTAIEFTFWTGWRIGEVLALEWDNIDFSTSQARLLLTKTAHEEYRSVPNEALQLLEKLDRLSGCRFVFPGAPGRGSLSTVRGPWYHIRERAGLDDLGDLGPLRVHDLRHNVVSWDVSRGVPLEIAGKNVGHRSRQATEVYAHFAPDALQRAADERAAAMRTAVESAKSDS